MIVTVTSNPSLDLLFELDRLVWDDANRVAEPRVRPGGQGINVARAARALGGDALAVAPLGGRTGDWLRTALETESVPLRVVPISGETRLFVGVRDRSDGRSLLLNPRGPELTGHESAALVRAVVEALDATVSAGSADWLACCGSLPPGAPRDLYARLGAEARKRAIGWVADCDGEALRQATESGCDLLVPNSHEAARLLGARIEDVAGAAAAAPALLAMGPRLAAITLGADGAVATDGQGVWHAAVPSPPAGSSAVGAGDAFLAGLLLALTGGAETADALRLAVAAGTAVLASTGAELIGAAKAAELLPLVRLRRIG